MNNEIDSSPIQRLGVFFLGLLTFAGFGFLAWIAFNFSGGDNDENYEMRSAERALKINEIISTQANGVIPTDDQLANYVSSNQEAEPKASKKPVSGTKAFDEWMKAQTAAAQAKEDEKTPEVKPEPEPEKEEKIVELTINALGSPPGTMKFKEVAVEVPAGSKVVLTFTNPDILQHNLIIVKPGKKDAVGALADAMLTDPEGMKKHYVPDTDDIIASSKLLNPGGNEKIEFMAPAEAGDYPYICTFPGHWRLMQGVMKVTE